MAGIPTTPSSPSYTRLLSPPEDSVPSRMSLSVCCRKISKELFTSNRGPSGRPTRQVHTFKPVRQITITNDHDSPLASSCLIPRLMEGEEFHQQLPIDLGRSGMDGFGYG